MSVLRRFCFVAAILLLACACREKENGGGYEASPAVEMELVSAGHSEVTLFLRSINVDAVYVLITSEDDAPSAETAVQKGEICADGENTFRGLLPAMRYHAYAVGVLGDKKSRVQHLAFSTSALAGDLYWWESARTEIPSFADITLCTGGGRPNSNSWFSIPYTWNSGRFAPHVSFTDDSGEHWLFDAFLAICGSDMSGNTYGITPSRVKSADKTSWEALLSYWFDKGGAFDELDAAVAAAASRIGEPPFRRHIVMVAPDPIMFEYFADKNSSTTYWGSIDGVQMDFSKVDHQIAAYEWFAQQCRERFNALNPKYLQFSGLYILSEELVAEPTGWNYSYKRWDKILPKVAEYLNQRNEGLYWIPYRKADGTSLWRSLGINQAWLQPNYYWDHNGSMPIAEAFDMMRSNGMGMELEFEYSMVEEVMSIPGIMGPDGSGSYVFTKQDVESLRGRFREYMQGYIDSGFYGKRPVALYSGSNAMWQLASSGLQSDRDMYLELCRFIAGSPLKN